MPGYSFVKIAKLATSGASALGSAEQIAAFLTIAAAADWSTGRLAGVGRAHLAESARMHPRRFGRVVGELAALRVLTVTPGAGAECSRYDVMPDALAPSGGVYKSNRGGVYKSSTGGCVQIEQGGVFNEDPTCVQIEQGGCVQIEHPLYIYESGLTSFSVIDAGARSPGDDDDDWPRREDLAALWSVAPEPPTSAPVERGAVTPARTLGDPMSARDEAVGVAVRRWTETRTGRQRLAASPAVVRQLAAAVDEYGAEAVSAAFDAAEAGAAEDFAPAYLLAILRNQRDGKGKPTRGRRGEREMDPAQERGVTPNTEGAKGEELARGLAEADAAGFF